MRVLLSRRTLVRRGGILVQVPVKTVSYTSRETFTRDLVAAGQRQGLSLGSAAVLTAHIALSTNWGKKMDNYRVAGMKAGAEWRATRPYTVAEACECKAGLPNRSDSRCICAEGYGQSYEKSYWRAYESLDAAVADMLSTLRGSRYSASYQLLQAADPEYFAQVGRDGWYTADPKQLKTLMSAHLEKIYGYLGAPSVADVGPALLIVAAAAWLLLRG